MSSKTQTFEQFEALYTPHVSYDYITRCLVMQA